MKYTITDAGQMELSSKVMTVKRVSKTVKGGCTMRFSALVVVDNGSSHVGAGLEEAGEAPEATHKGKEATIKNLVETSIDENKSIPHNSTDEFGSVVVLLERVPEGTSVIAGDPVRSILEAAEVRNIRTRSLGSNNKIDIVLITPVSLTSLKTPEEFTRLCGKSVEKIVD